MLGTHSDHIDRHLTKPTYLPVTSSAPLLITLILFFCIMMNEQFYKIVSVSEYDIQILIFFIKNVKQFFSNRDSKIHILALLQV